MPATRRETTLTESFTLEPDGVESRSPVAVAPLVELLKDQFGDAIAEPTASILNKLLSHKDVELASQADFTVMVVIARQLMHSNSQDKRTLLVRTAAWKGTETTTPKLGRHVLV